ncbi:DUF2971 domain-containing protein [Ectopseudomonas mendocina]|uniref:DUF2971 domain-containing protein n=1 Tax=Ectopseudomonas mendocina TaxID=300 RepID=A0ABZ2RIL4_ECTME
MELHHYTDVNGLVGIIQNKKLWATDIRFLNDSQEMNAGINHIKKICAQHATSNPSDNEVKKATRGLYNVIPDFIQNNLTKRNNYIVSFSRARDNLRQWMSYCPKNAGYSIEFHVEKILIDGVLEKEKKVVARLEDVSYNEDKISTILELKDFLKEIEKHSNSIAINISQPLAKKHQPIMSDLTDAMHRLANDLFFHTCAVKPKEFHDEQETRLIIQSALAKDHITKFRTKSGIIVPYFEYPIDPESIKGITIGPNLNMKLAREGLEDFLEKHSIECEVNESECSLRVF